MSDIIHLNRNVSALKESPAYQPFSGVRIIVGEDEDGHQLVYEAGDESFRMLEITNPYGTQAICNSIYNKIKGYAYKPYSANQALLDPAAELGDAVYVGDVYSVINSADTVFDGIMSANISAKEDGDIDHEYPYERNQNKEIERRINGVATNLTIELGRIEATVADTYQTKTDAGTQYVNLQSQITQTASSITSTVAATYETKSAAATMQTNLQSQITQTANSITSSVAATYETKSDATSKLNSANSYTNTIKSQLQTQITQTESSIKSTVAAATSKYDTTGIAINLYGYGTPSNSTASANNGKQYLDQSSGYYYKSNGSSWVRQNSTPLRLVTDTLNSKIEQTANQITLQVAGQYADAYPEWTTGMRYAAGDIVKVTTTTNGVVTDIDFYRCTYGHSPSSSNKPGSGAYWSSYWDAISTPTVQSTIDVNLGEIMIGVSESGRANSAYISIKKDGIELAGNTITMSNVVADTIRANQEIISPYIYNSRENSWIKMENGTSSEGWDAGFSLYNDVLGYNYPIFSARYSDVGVSYLSSANHTFLYMESTKVSPVGVWDFSGATVTGLN